MLCSKGSWTRARTPTIRSAETVVESPAAGKREAELQRREFVARSRCHTGRVTAGENMAKFTGPPHHPAIPA